MDDLDELRLLARERARDVAVALLGPPNAAVSTRATRRFGRKGASLAVEVEGPKRGMWFDHATGEGGDMFGLIQHERRCDFRAAADWLRGLVGGEVVPLRVERTSPAIERAEKARRERQRIDLARRLWREAVPAAGTVVEVYLSHRGLRLPEADVLRFHPECPRGGERLPAMVAKMTDAVTGSLVGVHRTFVRADGQGKAEGNAKMKLGHAGIVRLVADEDVTMGLHIAEGIETSLAAMQRLGFVPCWACLSAGGVKSFPVLGGIKALTVVADAGDVGEGAAWATFERWQSAGREASVFLPKAGDVDDATREAAA